VNWNSKKRKINFWILVKVVKLVKLVKWIWIKSYCKKINSYSLIIKKNYGNIKKFKKNKNLTIIIQ